MVIKNTKSDNQFKRATKRGEKKSTLANNL